MFHLEDSSKLNGNTSSDGMPAENQTNGKYRIQNTENVEKAAAQGKKKKMTAQRVDYASRFIFPLLFLVFNIVYWIYYRFVQ